MPNELRTPWTLQRWNTPGADTLTLRNATSNGHAHVPWGRDAPRQSQPPPPPPPPSLRWHPPTLSLIHI